jgi:uncharacterized protein (DUF2126 family)/transglutaminase-like putative cysteine protease
MTQRVALSHKTHYRYDRPTWLSPQIIRLRPAAQCRTPILAYALSIAPKRHFINWQQDPFGNFLARVVIPDATEAFTATVDLVADMTSINPFDFFVEDDAARWPFAYSATLLGELEPYLAVPPREPLLESYAAGIDASPRTTIDFICALNRRLARDIVYRVRPEAGVQSASETLAGRSGSCRDSGWLLVQLLRRMGLAARFVSGYLVELKGEAPREPAGSPGEDVAALHAWAEVFIPGAGWIGLDPTSGLVAGEGHIPLAATPSPTSAAPISGTHGAAKVNMSVAMELVRLRATPRPAAPYGEEEWGDIVAAGAAVEARLRAGDVRLSVGGEPTFVASDGGPAAEWNTAALGPTKRGLAERLARRLAARFGHGALLHQGLGKWYPGEPTPRWAYSIYWRSDREMLWRNGAPSAAERAKKPVTVGDAEAFAAALAGVLGLPGESAIAAYEDTAHFLLAEQRLPVDVAAEDNALADPVERARLARVFELGLGRPIGYVLPLLLTKAPGAPPRFRTERWAFKRGRLFVLPGDLPIGLRLPLGSLPQISFPDYPDVVPTDPFAEAARLPPAAEFRARAAASGGAGREPLPVRTGLVVEPREGHLNVFLPPLSDGEDYASLVAAVEEVAGGLAVPVRLEGYAPPFDPRLRVIKVTPDPGVIEVNVHPAQSWEEAVAITTIVYEEAQRVGLTAEKFLLDGRHVGTGGGSHIVLGGMTPADSPFLRRPDLLASVIAYWQNHPALSYLFAGAFVGPSSQAPRVDEARLEQLYELEIALARVPAGADGERPPPWLVDRLFRNLLVDVTGNTHRAEVCIDKLYAPDGPAGRLGLVELRAFDMPPHPRMSLAEQLLVRALIAYFWEHPYRRGLVRWGTALHDRFMLPEVLWSDLLEVVAELGAAGLVLDPQWFRPHFELRFPRLGAVVHGNVELELRQALEPWLVLGETGAPGGATRPVDSSLERVQVRLSSADLGRYAVACNGHAVPLAVLGRPGKAVAGVRFRVWRPSEGLHPTIAPHTPLTFAIVDTWSGRVIGGCRHHATHPDGRSWQTLPVNAREAEGRRAARFESMGEAPSRLPLKTAGVHPDAPTTLDLRRLP